MSMIHWVFFLVFHSIYLILFPTFQFFFSFPFLFYCLFHHQIFLFIPFFPKYLDNLFLKFNLKVVPLVIYISNHPTLSINVVSAFKNPFSPSQFLNTYFWFWLYLLLIYQLVLNFPIFPFQTFKFLIPFPIACLKSPHYERFWSLLLLSL